MSDARPLEFDVSVNEDRIILVVMNGLNKESVSKQLDDTGLTITCTGGRYNRAYLYHNDGVDESTHNVTDFEVKDKDKKGDGYISFRLRPKT